MMNFVISYMPYRIGSRFYANELHHLLHRESIITLWEEVIKFVEFFCIQFAG